MIIGYNQQDQRIPYLDIIPPYFLIPLQLMSRRGRYPNSNTRHILMKRNRSPTQMLHFLTPPCNRGFPFPSIVRSQRHPRSNDTAEYQPSTTWNVRFYFPDNCGWFWRRRRTKPIGTWSRPWRRMTISNRCLFACTKPKTDESFGKERHWELKRNFVFEDQIACDQPLFSKCDRRHLRLQIWNRTKFLESKVLWRGNSYIVD